jgi:hypothetical protein
VTRSLYRYLVWLHPPAFRRQFAEEILWIFDETAEEGVFPLFADCLMSLLRQWLVRSDVWKLAAGAGISSLLFFGLGYGQKSSLEQALRRGNPGQLAEERHRLLAMHGRPFGSDEAFGRTVQAGAPATSSEWPIRAIQISPRIAAVKLRVQAGDRHALDEFWQEAARTGTPLFEPGRDGAHEVIATFVLAR